MTKHSACYKAFVASSALLATMLLATPVTAQVVDLGTDNIGSVVNTTGTTLAKIISQKSSVNVRTRAFTGPEAWLPDMSEGKIQLGAHFAATYFMAHNNFETQMNFRNLRVLRSSLGTSPLGFLVRADSPIKTLADLKGKRIGGEYGAQPVLRVMSDATMQAHGFSYKDVSIVPLTNVVQSVAAVVDGRVDAAWASPSMPQVREANAKIKVRFIPFNNVSAAQEEAIRKKSIPSLYIDTFNMKDAPWLPEGTRMLTQEMYLAASDKTPDDVVKKVLQALWDNEEELRKAHPVMVGFVNKAAVTPRPVIPYHSAAVAFYKEKGVWSTEANKAHTALMN